MAGFRLGSFLSGSAGTTLCARSAVTPVHEIGGLAVIYRLALVPLLAHACAVGEVADAQAGEDTLGDLGRECAERVCSGLAREGVCARASGGRGRAGGGAGEHARGAGGGLL